MGRWTDCPPDILHCYMLFWICIFVRKNQRNFIPELCLWNPFRKISNLCRLKVFLYTHARLRIVWAEKRILYYYYSGYIINFLYTRVYIDIIFLKVTCKRLHPHTHNTILSKCTVLGPVAVLPFRLYMLNRSDVYRYTFTMYVRTSFFFTVYLPTLRSGNFHARVVGEDCGGGGGGVLSTPGSNGFSSHPPCPAKGGCIIVDERWAAGAGGRVVDRAPACTLLPYSTFGRP